ncbi:glutathione hydrolase 1 proenzyme-like [Schistocerca piceifrons]|uniref:glutathione hydrolase 1 proenzyme-like n=1 Tax=Schistocerca piceifrons TaxID=274613 RepID=UPI001F5FDBCE|nr:glutathione hydrolase 1 proenzyme-like [Schistocerca piceifrons]
MPDVKRLFPGGREKEEERIALLDAEPGPSFTYAQGPSNFPALGESSKAGYGTIERDEAEKEKKSGANAEDGGWDPEMKKVLLVAALALALFPLVMGLAWLLPYALDVHFRHAAVVADAPGCAHAGRLILSKGGSAVDSAVTTMLCQAVVHPHITGLGGGFVMLIYTAKTKKVETLNALPAVPSGFYNSSLQLGRRSKRGAESIAVPGTLPGLWEVHQKYGKLPWNMLFDAAIELSANGFKVSPDLAKNLAKHSGMILSDPNLSDIYKNQSTGKVAKEGDTIRNVYLARTLKLTSQLGPQALSSDELGDHLSKDIEAAGAHLRIRDLQSYRPQWQKPLSIDVKVPDKRTVCLHTTPLPTDGFKVALTMRLCEGHYDKSRASKQQMLSAFKTTYAVSHLVNNGNMDQVNKTLQQLLSSDRLVGIMKILSDRISTEDILYSADNMDTDLDSDASGFCIRASNGDAVAVASTLNSVFGSGVMSRYTGILLNNQMDKFVLADNVTHENGSNTIKLKQEVVSVAPTIILSSNGDLELVLSGGGGRYTSADTAYVSSVFNMYIL